MDIYDALKQDHETVKDILKKLRSAGDENSGDRKALVATLRKELEIHTSFEEEVFYPAVAERKEAKDDIADAIDEHDETMTMVEDLEDLDDGSAEWTEQLAMLADTLNGHIEEEESEIFEMARKTIDPQHAAQMAQDYAQQKRNGTERPA